METGNDNQVSKNGELSTRSSFLCLPKLPYTKPESATQSQSSHNNRIHIGKAKPIIRLQNTKAQRQEKSWAQR
jgi:hypothetical protein